MAARSASLLLLVALVAAALAGPAAAQRPNIIITCFVKNCGACSGRNPYICTTCNTGYRLTPAFGCNSCAVNYEQNLDSQSFSCVKCPEGMISPGGTGLASQCYTPSATSARRLFADADEDLWA